MSVTEKIKAAALAGATASKTASNSTNSSGKRTGVQRAYLRKENGHSIDSRWAEYSWRKSEWKHQNPGSTPAEYDAAVRRIARQCGV